MCGIPLIHATVRSTPRPKPECTKLPYFRRSRWHARLARHVHDREEQVADFVDERVRRLASRQLCLDLREFLAHLRQRARRVVPVEPHAGGTLLQPIRHQQLGQGGRQAVERATTSFPPLELFPRLTWPEVEEVGMPPLHLAHQALGGFLGRGLAPLLGDDELPREVQEEVAEFLSNGLGIVLAQGMIELQHLLDQVGTQRLASLGPVPGASHAEILHQGDHAAEGRRVLHECSVSVT